MVALPTVEEDISTALSALLMDLIIAETVVLLAWLSSARMRIFLIESDVGWIFGETNTGVLLNNDKPLGLIRWDGSGL